MSFTILPPTRPPPETGPDAAPPDDDSQWRQGSRPSQDAGLDPSVRKAAQLQSCEEKLDRAFLQRRPGTLLAAIGSGSCTALKSAGRDCAKCRICPSEEAWDQVAGYYRAQKGSIYICAEKEPTERQVEDTLTHELVHAYDHCRFGMRVPFVGWQAPWALDCAASACSQVRAHLLGAYGRHEQSNTGGGGVGGGHGSGLGGGFGGSLGIGAGNSFGSDGVYSGGGGGGGSTGFGGDGTLTEGHGSEGLGGDGSLSDGSLSDGSLSDGAFGGGGGSDGSLPESSTPTLVMEADPNALRNAVYSAALTSVSVPFGMNGCRGRNGRAVLDAIFNACITDNSPILTPPNPTRAAFPPMPPEVAAAEKGVALGGMGAALSQGPQGGGLPKSKWGEA